jgi:hypothetical protein
MPIFVLPFEEYNRGWYEIEAKDLAEAKEIVEKTDLVMELDGFYKDGRVDYDPEELTERKEN